MSEKDKRLEETITEYANLAKEDKSIDVASLMINALNEEEANKLKASTRRWSYLLSLGFPPLGYLLGVVFWFRSETDAKSTALACIVLTSFSLALTLLLFSAVFNSSGVSVEQIQQINPQEIYQLTQ